MADMSDPNGGFVLVPCPFGLYRRESRAQDAVVDITDPYGLFSWCKEIPYGEFWYRDIPTFLLKDFPLELTEVISAVCISVPDVFSYHFYFTVLDKTSNCLKDMFAEVTICMKELSPPQPIVSFCDIMESSDESGKSRCRFCEWWVRHPKGVETISLPTYEDHLLKRIVYTTTNVQRFIPEEIKSRIPRCCHRERKPFVPQVPGGIVVHDDCMLNFLELKAKQTHPFIIYKVDVKQMQVVVEKLGKPSETYEDLSASLPVNECRYVVLGLVTQENVRNLIFALWTPTEATVLYQRIYNSCKFRFKGELDKLCKIKFRRKLDGIRLELKATFPSGMTSDVFVSKC